MFKGHAREEGGRQYSKIETLGPVKCFLIISIIYLIISFLAFYIFKPVSLFYLTDYWEHRAIVAEVVRHGTALQDPIYGEAATSRQFSPWSLGLGFLARITGISVDLALETGAMLVSVLFIIGVWDFGRSYYKDRWGSAVLLATLCFAWGFEPLIWTGFYSLRSQLYGNYYPASIVFSLTFITWGQAIRLLVSRKIHLAAMALLIVIVAFSFVVHPLNAIFLIGGAIGLGIFQPDVAMSRRIILLVVLAIGVIVSTFWPYFNPLSLGPQGLAKGKEIYNNFSFFFSPIFIAWQAWPAMLGLLFIRSQWQRPECRMGVAALFAIVMLFVGGKIAGISVTHRLLAYVILALHIVLSGVLVDYISLIIGNPMDKSPYILKNSRIIFIIFGFLVPYQILMSANQLRRPWSNAHVDYPIHPVIEETTRLIAFLPPNSRPLGFGNAALVLPSFGVHVVVFPRPMPFSPTDDARQADAKRFFTEGTSLNERRAIAARWGATHVVYLDNEALPWMRTELGQLGKIEAPVGPWRVICLCSNPGK